MRRFFWWIFCFLVIFIHPLIQAQEQNYESLSSEIESSFQFQDGKVTLQNGIAYCALPNQYHFLDSAQTREMMINFWAESESNANHLGIISNISTSIFSPRALVFTLDYFENGLVSDKQQELLTEDELFTNLKKSIDSSNIQRKDAGLEFIQITQWALAPVYNKEKHSLYWIEEIEIGDNHEKRLSANACILGRRGYIRLASIVLHSELKQLVEDLPTITNSIQFYQDYAYNSYTNKDKLAEIDLDALILGYSLPDRKFANRNQMFYLIAFSLMLVIGILFWVMSRK